MMNQLPFLIDTFQRKLPDEKLLEGLSPEEVIQWIGYLYAQPRPTTLTLNLREHILSLYDPFARRNEFPAGRRFCCNIYVGCSHECSYCYTRSYIRDHFSPRVKTHFQEKIVKDLNEIISRKLHPAPLHISNSTDPLQPLEVKFRHTLFLLNKLNEYNPFSRLTMLTKNPELLTDPEYLESIKSIKNFQVEVSCAFFDDVTRQYYEPGAPSIESRLVGMRKLTNKGIKVAIRIDPVFPCDTPLSNKTLAEYGIREQQTEDDFEKLIDFAAQNGIAKIIVSPLKLVVSSKWDTADSMIPYFDVFKDLNNGSLLKKGSAFRMPWTAYEQLIAKPAELAASRGIKLIFCKTNLCDTI